MARRLADDIEAYLAEERVMGTSDKMVPEDQKRPMAEGLEGYLRAQGWVILPPKLGGKQ